MITVVKTDHGYGGPFDAKHEDVATFDTVAMAMEALAKKGYSVDWDGKLQKDPRRTFCHVDETKRKGLGIVTYSLTGLPEPLPHNRLP